MNEQELADEVCIVDKACRQCGAELAQGGMAVILAHEVAIKALVAKLKRLEVEKAMQMSNNAKEKGSIGPNPSASGIV